jgi:hypothetical protein
MSADLHYPTRMLRLTPDQAAGVFSAVGEAALVPRDEIPAVQVVYKDPATDSWIQKNVFSTVEFEI